MRKLLAVPLLVSTLTLCAVAVELPLAVGAVNDYGQTLDRGQRQRLAAAIDKLRVAGVELVYLASWRDPFGDASYYARQVHLAWELGSNAALMVFVRDERGRWHVAGHIGDQARAIVGGDRWEALRVRAESAVRTGPPGVAAVAWAEGLAERQDVGVRRTGTPAWTAWVAGAGGIAVVLFAARRFLCPHCLRPLRKRRSWGGILWACPRCRYTRALRRGSGPGSRGGFRP